MDTQNSKLLKSLPLLGSVIAIISGGFGIWSYLKPEDEIPALEGKWRITIRVEEASTSAYVGDEMVYDFFVTQDGQKLAGSGEQIFYNDAPAKSKFRVEIESASIKNDEVIFSYMLFGNDRPTNAMLKLKIDPENGHHLSGSYTGSAAQQKGLADVIIQ